MTNALGMKLVWIPPGTCALEANGERVAFVPGFWMGATEVTAAQWRAVTGGDPPRGREPSAPAEGVTWQEGRDFCRALSLREGCWYRLPTEAEWEYACRAGDGGAEAGAWIRPNAGHRPHPAGGLAPNAWGLRDMHGNVEEWCLDVGPTRAELRLARRPVVPRLVRALRGGSYETPGYRALLGCRTLAPRSHREQAGLRVVAWPTRAPVERLDVEDSAARPATPGPGDLFAELVASKALLGGYGPDQATRVAKALAVLRPTELAREAKLARLRSHIGALEEVVALPRTKDRREDWLFSVPDELIRRLVRCGDELPGLNACKRASLEGSVAAALALAKHYHGEWDSVMSVRADFPGHPLVSAGAIPYQIEADKCFAYARRARENAERRLASLRRELAGLERQDRGPR